MLQRVILKCPKGAKFRFGKGGVDVNAALATTDTLLRSDTLFSALICTAQKLGRAQELVDYFTSNQVQISSAFYCLYIKSKKKYIYFLPKPASFTFFVQNTLIRKRVKKVKYISHKVWEMGLTPDKWDDECTYINDKFIVHKSEFSSNDALKIYTTITRPRVTDQVRQPENNFYFQTELHLPINRNVHTDFYFFIKCKEESCRLLLETVLHILTETGIGGRISLGCGQLDGFDWKEDKVDFQINNPHESLEVCLSLIAITKDEIQYLKYYELETRGGRRLAGGNEATLSTERGKETIRNGLYLKQIRMPIEGAIVDKKMIGSIPSISPNDNLTYLRYGRVLSVPVPKKIVTIRNNV